MNLVRLLNLRFLNERAATNDRNLKFAALVGADCSPQAWPYYEADCLRDLRQVSRQAKPVRLITTDRIATR
jgi:hypothetical protein